MYVLFHELDRIDGGKRLAKPFKIYVTEILYYSKSDEDSSRCKLFLFGLGGWKDFEESYEQADEIITQALQNLNEQKSKKSNNLESSNSFNSELDEDDIQ
ncbi:MAG: hypothetical protein MUC49_21260 [Raineya sp.]|jgi:hypothetical protein|nr:hypothetical protein [Raineya sp.]